jgi:thiol-disulfide isomerase/thioredoxin
LEVIVLNSSKRRLLGTIFLLLLSTSIASTAQQKQVKPTIAVVYADWCPYCQALKPTLAAINEKYHSRVNFIRLDVTNETTTAKTFGMAKEKGFSEFFLANKEMTSMVAVFDGNGKEVFRTAHNFNRQDYEDALDRALGVAARKK